MSATTKTEEPILCRTRSGRKLHLGYATSSVTFCGHWQKVANSTYASDLSDAAKEEATDRVLCEHCFPSGRLDGVSAKASPAKSPDEMTFSEIRESGLAEATTLDGSKARLRAAYLLRTMTRQKRFALLSVEFSPRLAKVFEKVMAEGRSKLSIVADPRGDGYSFSTPDGDYGAHSLEEALSLARSLGYDDVEVER